MSRRVLVTGAAGFIGMHTAAALLDRGDEVVGVDNLDPYYDVALKEARLARLSGRARFAFERLDLADADATARLFREGAFDGAVHLAAQPGVRYSLVNPAAYFRANVDAFGCVLEGCRHARVGHLVYASSSSVYGANHTLPFSEDQPTDHPVSLYAATKKADEVIAHSYSHLYRLPSTGLRFFTVYGPWGRPDMAPMLFTRAILAGEPIKVFNHGRMRRDFTYVDDVAAANLLAATSGPGLGATVNIAGGSSTRLRDLVEIVGATVGQEVPIEWLPGQPGDVQQTGGAVVRAAELLGWAPRVSLAAGITRQVEWHLTNLP